MYIQNLPFQGEVEELLRGLLDIAKTKLSQQDIFDILFQSYLKHRQVLITEDVFDNYQIDQMVVNSLRKLALDSHEPVVLVIDSSGGDTRASYSIAGVIQSMNNPTIGIVTGHALSAAATVLLSCKHRFGYPLTGYMLHLGQYKFDNAKLARLISDLDQPMTDNPVIQNLRDQYLARVKWMAGRTGQDEQAIWELMQTEPIVTEQRALEHGIIHGIIDKPLQDFLKEGKFLP